MFEPIPELSSDLDWMLQSGQVSDHVLAEGLVEAYYARVYLLALSILDDPQAAHTAAQSIFTQALLKKYSYRSELGVKNWLFKIALEICEKNLRNLKIRRMTKATLPFDKVSTDFGSSTPSNDLEAQLWLKLDSLWEPIRFAVLLHYLLDLSEEEISLIFGVSVQEISARLRIARRELFLAIKLSLLFQDPIERRSPIGFKSLEDDLDRFISDQMCKRWPAAHFSDETIEEQLSQILKKQDRWGGRLRRVTSFKEVFITSLVGLLAIGLILAGSLWLNGPDDGQSPVRTVIITKLVNLQVMATPEPTPTPTPSLIEKSIDRRDAVFYAARQDDTLSAIADRLNINLSVLLQLNDRKQDTRLESGELIVIATLTSDSIQSTQPPAPQLSLASISSQISERIRGSSLHWKSLWYDARIYNYGPVGYVGPPQIRHEQVWIKQPFNSLVLIGRPGQDPDRVWFGNNGKIYQVDPENKELALHDVHPNQLRVYSGFEDMIFPQNLIDEDNFFIPIDERSFLGRDILIVEMRSRLGDLVYEFGVDKQTGMIFRARQFDPETEIITREYEITSLEVDPEIPGEIFDRNQVIVKFARSYRGEPLETSELYSYFITGFSPILHRDALPLISPPLGFDPSNAQLTFQWDQLNWGTEAYPVRVFAETYFLGEIMLANPTRMICIRSDDGGKIAIADAPENLAVAKKRLSWINLTDPNREFQGPEPLSIDGSMAFSPDSRSIAVFGCNSSKDCGIYIIYTEAGRFRWLFPIDAATDLIWKPDGSELAFLTSSSPSDGWNLMTVNTESGKMRYSARLNSQNRMIPSSAPIHSWVTDWDPTFSKIRPGLNACSLPNQINEP